MYRTHLCETCGMLFVFPDEQKRTFWMKNTRIPLDIYFYNARGQLVDVAPDMQPESGGIVPTVMSSGLAQYVLEVNADSEGDFSYLSEECRTNQ